MKRSLSAALIVLMIGACDPGPPAERTSIPNQAGEWSTQKQPSCQPADEPSYGTTIPGMWLEDLFLEMGAPGGHPVTKREVRDTGTALWIEIPAYEDALTLYATMISRPFPVNEDWDAPEREIERSGDFTIYFTAGDFPWESYVARDPEWQLALLAYAAKGRERIEWPDGVRKWLRAAIEETEHSPPDCEPGGNRPTADVYRSVGDEGPLKVFAPADEPWGWCPAHPERLTKHDLTASERAVVQAASEISGNLDTSGAYADSVLATRFSGSPDLSGMIEKDCGSEVERRAALVTLRLPEVAKHSASIAAETYFVSKERRGWVIWGFW